MYFKDLIIQDFGIFSGQSLRNLNPGLILIGGLNRAGKSSLRQILRYLGFGFSSKENLPPARRKYAVEATLVLEKGKEYFLTLKGYGKPNLEPLKGAEPIKLEEIYNKLDAFSYQQLFTISLDELQQIPAGISNQDYEKLQSILLGAGLKEFLLLPQLENFFAKEAEKIGGVHGTSSVKQFKPFYQQIQEGVNLRQKARDDLNTYRKKEEELRLIKGKITSCLENITSLERELLILDLLKNNYQEFKRYQELGLKLATGEAQELLQTFPAEQVDQVKELKDNYFTLLVNLQEKEIVFQQRAKGQEINKLKAALIEQQDQLSASTYKIPEIREKLKNYWKRQAELNQEEKELKRELISLNNSWQELSILNSIKTDLLEEKKLGHLIEEHKQRQSKQEQLKRHLEEIKGQRDFLLNRLELEKNQVGDAEFKKYFYLSLLIILGAVGLSTFYLWGSLILGFGGLTLLFFLSFYRLIRGKYQREEASSLKEKIQAINGEISRTTAELKKEESRLLNLENCLQQFQDDLKIKEKLRPEQLRDYFKELQHIKKNFKNWEYQRQEVLAEKEELLIRLQEIKQLLLFLGLTRDRGDKLLDYTRDLFFDYQKASELLELALEMATIEEKLQKIRAKIREIIPGSEKDLSVALNDFLHKAEKYGYYSQLQQEAQQLKLQLLQSLKTERIREALNFAAPDQENSPLARLKSYYDNYSSQNEIENSYGFTQQQLVQVQQELEELKSKKQDLERDLEELGTNEKNERANFLISEGRANLLPLAEKYAALRTASFILKTLRQRFMEKAENQLLAGASEYFARITSGQYARILPQDKIIDPDFKAVLADGQILESSNFLSRGTREQLFLAVRLSRIREIKPALPVIIDDSLSNFDAYHLEETVQLLKDLSGSHQVFLLTCHPHLIESVARNIPQTQYWKLKEGIFSKAVPAELIQYLKITKE